MPTLKLTEGEFSALIALFIDSREPYEQEDFVALAQKIKDLRVAPKARASTDAIWNALKGVVG
jgi:hypothetical protein